LIPAEARVSLFRPRLPVLLLLPALLAPALPAAPAAAGSGPREECAAALLMEAATGEILFAEHPDREWIPASVVKLMLLLLTQEALEAGRVAVTDEVTASPRAQAQGGSQVYLAAGETATLQRLLEAVAVGSANDATMAVAEHVFGSAEAAVAAMNERAARLGMTTTRYVNVTGLPERGRPDNRSSVRDQALLAREIVLRRPAVLDWTRLTETEFRPGLKLHCTNHLLKRCPGVDGLKTGYHGKARYNLVATAQRDGRRLIAVVMGSPSAALRNRVATRLLESGFRDWQLVTGLQAGAGFPAEFPVRGGWRGGVPVLAAQTLQYTVTPEQAARVRIQLAAGARLEAPLKAGEVVGQIQATVDGRLLASVPAVAGRGVARRWFGKGDAAQGAPWPELPARASARGREP
jgi:D-alanyl-D-alanine carboxypeptidase (penicillin-binding protein 5/6)